MTKAQKRTLFIKRLHECGVGFYVSQSAICSMEEPEGELDKFYKGESILIITPSVSFFHKGTFTPECYESKN